MERTINAKFLTDLKRLVMNGEVSQDGIKSLHERYATGDIGDVLAEYRESGNISILDKIDEKMAVKAIIYRSRVRECPVVKGGNIVSSKELDKVYYERPWIPGVVGMRWEDQPVIRKNNVDHPKHAPMHMEFNGKKLSLVCETKDKSFYFETIPDWAEKFLVMNVSQKVSDLATVLKRPGIEMSELRKLKLNTKLTSTRMIKNRDGVEKDVYDMGVWVLPKADFRNMMDHIGIKGLSPLQITVIGDGIYFKGTVTCETLANMVPAIYGGIKKAEDRDYMEDAIIASVMDSFVHTPWKSTLNRQQCDYTGCHMPINIDHPSKEVTAKAMSGFGPYVDQFNSKIIASSGKMLKKISVKGYAGKCSIGNVEEDVQFIVRSNRVSKRKIKDMVWLVNPSLPVYKEFPLVKVLIVPDKRIDGHLLQVNMNDKNLKWVSDIYISLYGRDADGDGFTLTDDPIFWALLSDKVVASDKLTWLDTTKFKGQADKRVNTREAAIIQATHRIRTASGDVGRVDKLARRIYRYDSVLLDWELSLVCTGAIQSSITAQKKKTDRKEYTGGWIYKFIESDVMKLIHERDEYGTFLNMHDTMDGIAAACKKQLSTDQEMRVLKNMKQDSIIKARYNEVKHEHALAKQMISSMRKRMKDELPDKHSALTKTLALVITKNASNDETFRVARDNAEVMYAVATAKLGIDRLIKMDEDMIKIRKIWGSVGRGEEDNVLNYRSAARIIKAIILTMYEAYGEDNVIAAVVAGPHKLSDGLLAKIINEKHMAKLGMDTIMYIPIAAKKLNQKHMEGVILGRGELTGLLADKHFINAIGDSERFQIIKAIQYDGINWNTNSGSNKQSSYLLKVRAL